MGRIYPEDTINIVKVLHQELLSRKLSIATAESCTGGRIADLITEVPGASRFFKGSVVAYQVEIKEAVLGVPDELISKHGVVSAEIAREMATRVRNLMKTDIGVSSTGNLGPEALEGKDVGLIYIGISIATYGTWTKQLRLRYSREENKQVVSVEALRFLIEMLSKVSL